MLSNIFKGRHRPSAVKEAEDGGNWCQRIVEHPDVELLVNLVIVLNCVALAMENPMLGALEGRNATLWWIGKPCRHSLCQRPSHVCH